MHCRNSIDETPLHIAAKAENYSESVVKLLLDRGAHLDVPDERRIRDGRDSHLLAEKFTLRGVHQVVILFRAFLPVSNGNWACTTANEHPKC